MIKNILRSFSSTKIDCYTNRSDVLDLTPIEYSNKVIPEWFKNTKPSYECEFDNRQSPTIKHCEGFKNLLKTGFVLRLWSDLRINIHKDGYTWVFADQKSETEWHNSNQWKSFYDEDKYYHIKIKSPYKLVCNDDTKFYCTPHELFPHNQLKILSGILDFKHQHSTHINCFIEKKEQEIVIPHGFPLYQFIPLTNNKVKIQNKLTSKETMTSLETPTVKFVGNYNYIKKCPFHKR
mgnify:CR=1 FL=1